MTHRRSRSVAQANTHLSAILDEVVAEQEFTITRRGRPVARLVPVEADRRGDAGTRPTATYGAPHRPRRRQRFGLPRYHLAG